MEDEKRDAYKLAFDEAVRGLAHQQSRLDDFRARGGILLSADIEADPPFPIPMIHRDLALHMEDSYISNEV